MVLNRWPEDRLEKREALLGAVSSVSDTVAGNVSFGEEHCYLHPDSWGAIHNSGLLSLKLPSELGGAEADPVTQLEVLAALASIDTSAAWCTMVSATNVGSAGAFLPNNGIDIVFGRESSKSHPTIVGVGMPFGEARASEDGFVVSGRWPYGSGIKGSEWVTAGAKILCGVKQNRSSEIRALFRTSEVQIIDNWNVAGLRGSGSNDYAVSKAHVPLELTWSGDDLPLRGGALYRIKRPAFVVFGHAGIAIGTAKRALQEIRSLSLSKARGIPGQSLIGKSPHFQMMLGNVDLKMRSIEALSKNVFEQAWNVAKSGEVLSETEQSRVRAVGSWVTREAVEIVDSCFHAAGGSALNMDSSLQQCFRDMHAAAQHFMVSPNHVSTYGAIS